MLLCHCYICGSASASIILPYWSHDVIVQLCHCCTRLHLLCGTATIMMPSWCLPFTIVLATVRWLWLCHTELHLWCWAATLAIPCLYHVACHCHITLPRSYHVCIVMQVASVMLCCHMHDALFFSMLLCIFKVAFPLPYCVASVMLLLGHIVGVSSAWLGRRGYLMGMNTMIGLTSWVGSV